MKINTRQMAVFAMLGSLMYASKLLMEVAPNIHFIGVFVIAFTVVYREKALYPIYIFVFISGLFAGFQPWWFTYLYIWTVLWGVTMLLPKHMPKKVAPIVYMLICATHGFLYGILYAPIQALFFGLSIEGTVAWIVAGLPWDMIHGISNFFCGILIVPIVYTLRKLENSFQTM